MSKKPNGYFLSTLIDILSNSINNFIDTFQPQVFSELDLTIVYFDQTQIEYVRKTARTAVDRVLASYKATVPGGKDLLVFNQRQAAEIDQFLKQAYDNFAADGETPEAFLTARTGPLQRGLQLLAREVFAKFPYDISSTETYRNSELLVRHLEKMAPDDIHEKMAKAMVMVFFSLVLAMCLLFSIVTIPDISLLMPAMLIVALMLFCYSAWTSLWTAGVIYPKHFTKLPQFLLRKIREKGNKRLQIPMEQLFSNLVIRSNVRSNDTKTQQYLREHTVQETMKLYLGFFDKLGNMRDLQAENRNGNDPEITNISTFTKQSVTSSIVKDELKVHGLYAEICKIVTDYLINKEYQDIFHRYFTEEIQARDRQINEQLQQQAQSDTEAEMKGDIPDGQLRQRKNPQKPEKNKP